MATLLHELIFAAAASAPSRPALKFQAEAVDYAQLAWQVQAAANGFLHLGIQRRERIAIYLDKRIETVVAMFGAAAAGAVFVPVNPVLKAAQVGHILRDCNVRMIVTSPERLEALRDELAQCPDVRCVIVVGAMPDAPAPAKLEIFSWNEITSHAERAKPHPMIDADMVAIFYTSGSTGKPKGVVLSHRNVVTGARSVSQYLCNCPEDRILSVLPLSFDAGFSQLTTAFASNACVVLLNYLLARDLLKVAQREGITGITAVPPIWIQLAQLEWPESVRQSLRYIANTGGHMPRATLDVLRGKLPSTQVFLMYGLTESFRSTYLPPSELDRRPDSIGKAIPNAEVLVVREDGSPCAPGESGELVHRGALVSLGYWNDPEKTAERFRPAPGQPKELVMPEIAVWSGDTVRIDEEGYIYFIGRKDEMIKTSGYRVSPTEIEEVLYGTGMVSEVAAVGVPHPVLGQAIVVFATPADGTELDVEQLLASCRERLPAFMVPGRVEVHAHPLPRNPNGKIDRKLLSTSLTTVAEEAAG